MTSGAGATALPPKDRLEGELVFATVSAILPRAEALASGPVLDLARVTRVDSAGLALLLELTRRAKRRGGDLVIEGADAGILRLATFFGLNEVLTFRLTA